MFLRKLRINNYKSFKDKTIEFNNRQSILVGENEEGKTTIIEAIQMVLTGKLNYKRIDFSLNAHLFNNEIVDEFITGVKNNENPDLPKIEIEAFFEDSDEFAVLKGNNNSLSSNLPGLRLIIEFDENYDVEYRKYLEEKDDIISIPIEYYTVNWFSFAYSAITLRSVPLKIITIDNNLLKSDFSLNNYISRVVDDTLTKEQKASLSLGYRKLTDNFSNEPNISMLNDSLSSRTDITDKKMKLTLDTTIKNTWERNINLYLNEIPFEFIGSGEKNKIHTMLSIELDNHEANIILIEEPENNLSYGNMRKLVNNISNKCKDKQLIITTHDPYILNRLGLDSTILLKNGNNFSLDNLKPSTKDYFKKLPGYDTLRLILANKAVLVEGPSDELIINKAYYELYTKYPIDNGVDIICVNGLSFKRFLEIAKELNMLVHVVTDNDKDIAQNILERYKDYKDDDFIKIHFDSSEDNYTLEKSLIDSNGLEKMNEILEKSYEDEQNILNYMLNNKTKCALKIFESTIPITYPKYIDQVVRQVENE